jgi:hypothetical protein
LGKHADLLIQSLNGKLSNFSVHRLISRKNSCSLVYSFAAENWQHGWMGKFMWGVLTEQMGLEGRDILAMTAANFSMATSPRNITSVYKGSSSTTRCVWEVYLGNVVSI